MMDLRWIGAILIIAGCGGIGFMMALQDKRELDGIVQLIQVLEHMSCELSYRMTPLPQLCRQVSQLCRGSIRSLFLQLAIELDSQLSPDVDSCMHAAVSKTQELPSKTAQYLLQLGTTLGHFDLQGQLRGLENLLEQCRSCQSGMENNKDQRLRSYQTLGLCAGAALAILFL